MPDDYFFTIVHEKAETALICLINLIGSYYYLAYNKCIIFIYQQSCFPSCYLTSYKNNGRQSCSALIAVIQSPKRRFYYE